MNDRSINLHTSSLQKLNLEMNIETRIAIAINDEKQVWIEWVACMIFQENGKSLQLEFSGIEAQKQKKNVQRARDSKLKVEKRERTHDKP